MVSDNAVATKYVQLRKNAQRRGLEFDLRLADVRRLLSRKTCFYTGEVLCDESVEEGAATHPNKRTFDRVDNTKGYVRGNVVACSHRVNQFKSCVLENKESVTFMGLSALLKLAKKLKEIHYDR